MVQKLIILLSALFFLGGCSLAPRKSGIEVISYPGAKIYLDGKEAGMTPYKNSSLQPGEVEIKIVPDKGEEWSQKLTLQNYTTTVIERDFGEDDRSSGGYMLYLEGTGDKSRSGLIVNAVPDKATVKVDGDVKGFSPMKLDDFGEGDKQVNISFPGHKSLNIFVKAIKGYQLIIEADLAVETDGGIGVKPEVNRKEQEPLTENKIKVTIKETETGWLRVREIPSGSSAEVGRVNPGEKFNLIKEENGWYQIEMTGKTGWISSRYAEKD